MLFWLGVEKSHPPTVQTFCSQVAANQKKVGLKEEMLKRLVSDIEFKKMTTQRLRIS